MDSIDSTPTWWLYVLECRGGILYIGIAKDVEARFDLHVKGAGARFTRLNPPVRVLARACVATRSEALRAEHALKQLPRAQKLRWCDEGLDAFVAGRRDAVGSRP
jgi:putative endonuclease